jgi:hypothetical protein
LLGKSLILGDLAVNMLMDGHMLRLLTMTKETNSVSMLKVGKLGNSTLMMKFSTLLILLKNMILRFMELSLMKAILITIMFTLSLKPSPHLTSGFISMIQMVKSVIYNQTSLMMEQLF